MRVEQKPIYLDYAAATPLDERVLAIMRPYMAEQYFNPSSPYLAAKQVKQSIGEARDKLARCIGAKSSEIIMTAGATESINLAIWGVMSHHREAIVVATAIEHPAVLESIKRHSHQVISVLPTGLVDFEQLRAAISDETVLVSVGYVNNELGTVQPIREIAALVADIRTDRLKKGNATPIYLHTDASQAAGYLDLNTSRLGVDMMSLNAAKCYGPKQTGLLWVKSTVTLEPLIVGGGQERNVRSGTESPASIIGFAEALAIVEAERKQHSEHVRLLRDRLQHIITAAIPETIVNGHRKRRSPNHLHLAWPGADAERILFALDERGVMVATGSACAANKGTRSHVLTAIGMDPTLADGSIRITLGRPTSEMDISRAATEIIEVVRREMSR